MEFEEYDYLEIVIPDNERMEILKHEGKEGWKFVHQERTAPNCVRILMMKKVTHGRE